MSSTHSPVHVVDESALLAELGIGLPRQIVCRVDDAAAGAMRACTQLPGSRVVVKIAEPFVAHKTEVGGVKFVDKEQRAIRAAIDDLAVRLDAREVAVVELIEHDVAPGGELLLAIRWTRDFGAIVTLGAGGVAAEVLSSVAVLAPGLATDVELALRDKSFATLLRGFRGQKARIPERELHVLLTRCLAFASTRLPHALTELEINPLVPTAHGLFALDVLIEPGHVDVHADADRPITKIESLLHPRSMAVMGVSATSMNPGRVIARRASESTPALPLQIVKSDVDAVDGIPCVSSIAELDPVDLLVLAIPAEQVVHAVDDAIAYRKAESILAIPGGLTEAMTRRVRASLASSRLTAGRGPVLNGANCVGVLSPGVNTIFLPREKFIADDAREVPLAVVAQSGALAVSLMTRLAPYAPRYVVSIGNQLDLTAADYLQYFGRDPNADVMAFYVEGFAPLDGRRFFENAARLTRSGRTVILYRAGRTAAGAQATSSHTASIAGDVVVARELARAAGVLFAESLDEFTDLVRLSVLLRDRRAHGNGLGAMSNAGFEAVAIADNHGALQLAQLTARTRGQMERVIRESRLDGIVGVTNPLDVNPMLGDAGFARLAELLIDDEGVDLAVIGCIPHTGALRTLPEEIASEQSIVKMLTKLWESTSKPWVAVVDGGALYDPMARRLEEDGIPVFRAADRAVRALGKWSATLSRT